MRWLTFAVLTVRRAVARIVGSMRRAVKAPLTHDLTIEILGALLFVTLGFCWLWFYGPRSYRVYVVGDFRHDGSSARQFFEAVQKSQWSRGRQLTIDGIPVTLAFEDDGASLNRARETAKELVARDDTLLVIGHFDSRITQNVLSNIYMQAEPPVPMILPNETTPAVVSRTLKHYQPVFRLAPSDDAQAVKVARFLRSRGCSGVLAIRDKDVNSLYANYLLAQLNKEMLVDCTG